MLRDIASCGLADVCAGHFCPMRMALFSKETLIPERKMPSISMILKHMSSKSSVEFFYPNPHKKDNIPAVSAGILSFRPIDKDIRRFYNNCTNTTNTLRREAKILIEVDLHSRKPIYEQLVDNITMLVMSGFLKADEQVPSVRQLAMELAVNPNTVQKAFLELERRGVLYSVAGKGRFVNGELDGSRSAQSAKLMEELNILLGKIKKFGVPRSRIEEAVDSVYSDGKAENNDKD